MLKPPRRLSVALKISLSVTLLSLLGFALIVGYGAFEHIRQARAQGNLVIETREIRHVTDVEIRELPARVERMERLAPEVMGLWLRLPAIEPFAWQAGQYIDVMLPGERRRSFSLANPPHDASFPGIRAPYDFTQYDLRGRYVTVGFDYRF